MIFSNLITSFLQLIFKPKIWVPLFGMLIISTAVTLAMGVVLEKPMIDLMLYPNLFSSELQLSVFLTQYPVEILLSIILALAMTTIGIAAYLSTSRIAQGEGLVKSINTSMNELKKSIGFSIVFWGAFLFALFVFTLVTIIIGINEIIGFILLGLFLLICIVVFIKMIFAIPALVESEVKEAFGESWKFTQKRFWKTTAYLILTGLIIIIFGSLINFAGTLIAGTFIELIVLAIGEIFTSLYFIVAITNYFYSKQ